MNVLIVEDEKLTASRLENLLLKYDSSIRVLAILPSVMETVSWFRNTANPKPDLIFLDIHLEDDLGFRIIEILNLTTPIIFTTAFNEYMLKAFKVNSIDYLLKPIDADELAAALQKFERIWGSATTPTPRFNEMLEFFEKNASSTYRDRFMVTVGTKLLIIKTTEIAYFQFEDKGTFLITHSGQRFALDYSLDKLMQLLDPHAFFRINRSFLIGLSSIKLVHMYTGSKLKIELVPSCKHEVFVSGDRISSFKEWLGK